MEDHDLFAPVKLTEGVSEFKKIGQPEEVYLDQLHTQKPAKEVLFPQSEVMFYYEKKEGQTQVLSLKEMERERILLGAKPCEIKALSIIEKVFIGEESIDVYFLEKRKKTIIIGLACNHPLSTCFCTSIGGSPFGKEGSDLFLIDLGESFLIEGITEKGLFLQGNQFLKEPNKDEIHSVELIESRAFQKVDSSVPVEGIEKRLDLMMESTFWNRVHEKCVGCRICTYLCPTCYCFDIDDVGGVQRGKRVRNWDSCLSPLYTLETSGHNPRLTGRERTRQRIMHKFNYYPKIYGEVACVGCGRCILYCPVQFDIRKVILWTSPKRPKKYEERSS